MTIKLLPEQEEDAMIMARSYDLPNFSKAGTGKTLTALRAVELAALDGGLVACPKIALHMWRDNITAFLGARVDLLTSGSQSPTKGSDFVVTTYDLLPKLKPVLWQKFVGKGWAMINDESHKVRSGDAKRTQAIFGQLLDLEGGLAARFEQVWNLSGTPMERYADDYFTQVACLHPDVFKRYNAETLAKFERVFTFKKQKQYNERMQPKWVISGNINEGMLRRIIYQEIGAIRRMEAPGLPEIRHRQLTVDLKFTAEERRLLKGLTHLKHEQIVAKLNDDNSPISSMWRAVGLGKVHEVVPYVGELAAQTPVLVGIWHRDVGNAYERELKAMKLRVVQVNGSTSTKDKLDIEKRFNDGAIDVLIGQMGAMGVSWNIQRACSSVVIAEEYPSSATVEQFYKRVYRYGQKNAVDVDYIYSENPVDEAINGVRLKKEKSDLNING